MGLFTPKAPSHIKSDWSGLKRTYSKSCSSETDIESWSIEHLLRNLYIETGALSAIPEILEDCTYRKGAMYVIESEIDYTIKMINILRNKLDEEKLKALKP